MKSAAFQMTVRLYILSSELMLAVSVNYKIQSLHSQSTQLTSIVGR
jgi:hypothetical protein